MINEEKLSLILAAECKKIAGNHTAYSTSLHKEAVSILLLEHEHKMKTTPIQNEIRERCRILGKFISKNEISVI